MFAHLKEDEDYIKYAMYANRPQKVHNNEEELEMNKVYSNLQASTSHSSISGASERKMKTNEEDDSETHISESSDESCSERKSSSSECSESSYESCLTGNSVEDNLENPQPSTFSSSTPRVHRKRIHREKPITRKRRILKHTWLDVQAKKARASGKGGEGRGSKVIKPRSMGSGCFGNCRFKCKQKITDEARVAAFNAFWNLESKVKQWQCLNNWVVPKKKKNINYSSEDSAGEGESQKCLTYVYMLPSPQGKVVVCKNMFLKTLDISYQWVRTAKQKFFGAGDTGADVDDMRGKHKNRPNKISNEARKSVIDHIKSFPVIESHYCRENCSKRYLEEGLNITLMYSLYKEKAETTEAQCVSHQSYEHIFNTEFNYGFFVPKKDRCEKCEIYKNLEDDEKTMIVKKKYSDHIQNKVKARELMKEAKQMAIENDSACSITFDLHKILSTPKAEISPLYYMSKLNVWNFTIFDLATHMGYCNVWNETIGCRGSNEIASFLYSFIWNKSKAGVNEFYLFSDNCSGQYRNKNVFSMLVKASLDFKAQITHRFLEVGHTQTAGDCMHACIERYTSRKDVFTQGEWCRLIKECKRENPYIVKEKEQDDIFSFDELSEYFHWNKIKISSVREISVKNVKNQVDIEIKYDLTKSEERVNILKKNCLWSTIENYTLPKAYEAKIPLKKNKAEDLQRMVNKNYIPNQFHDFFKDILEI